MQRSKIAGLVVVVRSHEARKYLGPSSRYPRWDGFQWVPTLKIKQVTRVPRWMIASYWLHHRSDASAVASRILNVSVRLLRWTGVRWTRNILTHVKLDSSDPHSTMSKCRFREFYRSVPSVNLALLKAVRLASLFSVRRIRAARRYHHSHLLASPIPPGNKCEHFGCESPSPLDYLLAQTFCEDRWSERCLTTIDFCLLRT